METPQESFIEDVKVEVKEEDVASTCEVDPLFLDHHTSAWTEDDTEARNLFTVSKCIENPQEVKMEQYFSESRMKKIKCELPDPYKIVGWVNNMKEWPDLNSGYIHQYLLCNQNPLSHHTTSASLDGYECFRTGNVLAVEYNRISSTSPVCFLKAKVVPPYSVTAEPHEPWVCLEKTEGSIQSSHCTCTTGFKEVCSHIAGLLFKVEAAVSLGMNKEDSSSSSSSKLAVWNRYYKSKNHIARVRDMDFSHPNKPKRSKRSFKQLKPLPLSESEQKKALDGLRKILPKAIIFMKRDADTDTASEPEEDPRLLPHLDHFDDLASGLPASMPRKFVPKGLHQTDRTALEAAFKHRVETQSSIRDAWEQFRVKVMTLQDAFQRSKKFLDGKTFVPLKPNAYKVFSDAQERHLLTYAIKIAKIFYGLKRNEFRKLAYRYAVACKSDRVPEPWEKDQAATHDWYYAFMSRHPELTLKAPEGIAFARAIAFNRTNVSAFFEAFTDAMEMHKFTPDRIYNMDETSLSTVMKPIKVICAKRHPVASQITHERGSTMTVVGIINAAGHYIPPVFIIPRKQMNDSFMRGTIDGSRGILHQNGWMNGECFLETLQHIQATTFCTKENKILLIMDNAECHMSIHAIEYAIENGIIIVALPPHTTDKLQPLNVSVFGPFKSYLRGLMSDYLLMHPQSHITEHMLPEFASKAWIKACTPSNVLCGFAATGIWPINSNIFPDEAFLGSQVSERPPPPAQQAAQEQEDMMDEGVGLRSSADLSEDSSSSTTDVPHLPETQPMVASPSSSNSGTSSLELTPETVCPYPKAPARPIGKGRKKVRACILTANEEAVSRLRDKEMKKRKSQNEQDLQRKRRTHPGKQKVTSIPDNSDEEDTAEIMHLNDSSDEAKEEDIEMPNPFQDKDPAVDDFVLVELELEEGQSVGSKVHYVGRIINREENCKYIISFLRMSSKHPTKDQFYFPVNEDVSVVSRDKIKGVLVEPKKSATKRLARIVKFKTALTAFNMK